MLQHNISSQAHGHGVARAGAQAHLAHAAVIAMHTFCCGLPILALALAGLSGVSAGASLFVVSSQRLHGLLHAHEIWILALSGALVSGGAALEWSAIRAGVRRRPSPLFALSCACFVFNLAILAVHRGV